MSASEGPRWAASESERGAAGALRPRVVVGAGDRNRTGDIQLGNSLARVSRKCHFVSESLTSSRGREPQVSRLITPSHGIWAASWAAATGYRVMAEPASSRPWGFPGFTARPWSVGMVAAFDALRYGLRIRSGGLDVSCTAAIVVLHSSL
jgi:hypothetical protein